MQLPKVQIIWRFGMYPASGVQNRFIGVVDCYIASRKSHCREEEERSDLKGDGEHDGTKARGKQSPTNSQGSCKPSEYILKRETEVSCGPVVGPWAALGYARHPCSGKSVIS